MATTIEIHGSSNDTNLVLASDSASIADNGTTDASLANVSELLNSMYFKKNTYVAHLYDYDPNSPGKSYLELLRRLHLNNVTTPFTLTPKTTSYNDMQSDWQELMRGDQIMATTFPIYLFFNADNDGNKYSPHGGFLQDAFPFSNRSLEAEVTHLKNLWELPGSTASDPSFGAFTQLLQSDLNTSMNNAVLAFPFYTNTGSILGQYDFEIVDKNSFANKKVRFLPNNILGKALASDVSTANVAYIPGSGIPSNLANGTFNGAEFQNLYNNVVNNVLDQSSAIYTYLDVVQEYISTVIVLVNRAWYESLTTTQKTEFHKARIDVKTEFYNNQIVVGNEYTRKLRAGEPIDKVNSAIVPKDLSTTAKASLKTMCDNWLTANLPTDPILKAVHDAYTGVA